MTDPGARLRDQFFALRRAPGSSYELARRRFRAEVDALDAEPIARLPGLSLSYFPTARFKALRFVDAARLDEAVRPLFARPCPDLPELAAAFVDPEEYSYCTFENVIGLDRLFTGLGARALRLERLTHPGDRIIRARFSASEPLRARLARLDALDLHVPPPGPARGGQRFIFHSAELAAALTDAVRAALPARLLRGFVHVNPVFRCNRFEPGDAPFSLHHDSPYYQRSRRHVSRYTLLLYLTPGRGEPALRFADGPAIATIEPDTAFIFFQGLAHEGRPYLDGRKVFLRTELIFEAPDLADVPDVGRLFARACYLDSESAFAPELAAFAHQSYERAAAAHWRGPPEPARSEPYVHKQFRGLHFISNGHDYWFDRRGLGPIDCAAVALLDLVNAHIDGRPFRSLCTAAVHVREPDDRAWIAALLRDQPPAPEPVFARLDKTALLPEPEEPRSDMDFPSSPDFSHTFPDDWDATRHPRVVDEYTRARRWAMRRIFTAPIVMLGKELFLDPARFVVAGDTIHILSRDALGPVHFAGAVFFEPPDFVGVDVTVAALQPLVPPMWFHETGDLLHLCCDLFRNAWMVSHPIDAVPVPRVLDGLDVDPDVGPWLRAAGLDKAALRADDD